MKIKSVRADWLHVPIPEQQQHTSDFGKTRSFDSTLVRIETEGGLVGFGEAKAAVGSAGTNAALNAMVQDELGPLLIGEDARVKTTAREHTQKSCQRERLIEELVLPLRSKKFPSSSRIRKQNGKRVQQWKQERKR